MVAMAAIFRKLGSVFSRVRAGSRRSSRACASLSAMAAPHSDFSGYAQPGLVGIQNRQRHRHRIAGLRQVVVGDDQVQPQPRAVSASAKALMPVSTVITSRTPSAYAASSTLDCSP